MLKRNQVTEERENMIIYLNDFFSETVRGLDLISDDNLYEFYSGVVRTIRKYNEKHDILVRQIKEVMKSLDAKEEHNEKMCNALGQLVAEVYRQGGREGYLFFSANKMVYDCLYPSGPGGEIEC